MLKCGGRIITINTKSLSCGDTRCIKRRVDCSQNWFFYSSENVVSLAYVTLERIIGDGGKTQINKGSFWGFSERSKRTLLFLGQKPRTAYTFGHSVVSDFVQGISSVYKIIGKSKRKVNKSSQARSFVSI